MSLVWFSESARKQILWAVCDAAGRVDATTLFGARGLHPEAPRRAHYQLEGHFSLDLPATTTGRDVQELIRRRDVRSMSFGFRCLEDKWELKDGIPHREGLRMQLLEISPVPLGAYDATSIRLTD
jgi:hypothetical protein